MKVLWF